MARQGFTRMLVVGAAVVGLTGAGAAVAVAGMPIGPEVSIQADHGDDDFGFDDRGRHGFFDDRGRQCFGLPCVRFDDGGHHRGGHH